MNVQHTPLFQNGMELLFPRTEDGPSIYALMEGAWMFAALIQGIRTEVWKSDISKPNPVAACWAKLGLLEVVTATIGGLPIHEDQRGILTAAGQRVVDCQGLLEYEFSMMNQQLDSNFVTDPAMYQKLRGGLDNYARAFMPDMHYWITQQAALDGGLFFDFCGGDGGYLHSFLKAWPQAQGMLFDRAPKPPLNLDTGPRMSVMVGDALGDHVWFACQAGAYDVVLMSEILHCKGPKDRQFLLQRAKSLLKPTGVLLVVEQYPNLRLEWRMHDMTDGGQCLSEQEVAIEAEQAGFVPVSGVHSLSHFGLRLEQA